MEHPSFTLAGLCAVGGTMGFLKKKSVPSLVAGLTFAGIYGYAGYLLKQNADNGIEIALGASALLLATGVKRSLPSRFTKPVPLVLSVLGLAGTSYYGLKYKQFYLD
ncbi:hypothetical protein ACO0QE_004179 [Hanseniaspora vineae]|uniref:TMEM14 protein n=1 Tax=Hanseniaspora osmophila TaxID=56408 RepID=A0A1E5RB20_9ASCO|nr:Uncharacterized protein AWRI3579_g3065 [Hanseniaspora osmophila]